MSVRASIPVTTVLALLAACGSPTSKGTPPASSSQPSISVPSASATVATPLATTQRPAETLPTFGTWDRLEVDGPTPKAREDHTWTLAEDGRTAFLFGGRDGGNVYDDLWAFDLAAASWRRVQVAGQAPAARFGHEAAWVPDRGLAVFAGQAGADFFNDVWIFDPKTSRWQRQPDGGDVPVPRYGSCSGIGPDGRLWISHGFTEDGIRFADTKAYDFDAGSWEDEAPAGEGPIPRCLHACWWMSDGRFALYGGQTTGVPALGDLWFLTPGSGGPQTNAWSESTEPGPPPRQLAAVAQRGPITFLFGGRGTERHPLGDMFIRLDGTAVSFLAFRPVGEAPAARSGATMISDRQRDRLLLFGGLGDEAFGDLWQLTVEP